VEEVEELKVVLPSLNCRMPPWFFLEILNYFETILHCV
jgi:hypothetical protein